MKHRYRVIAGALLWSIAAGAMYAVAAYRNSEVGETRVSWADYLFGSAETLAMVDPTGELAVDDPVFLRDDNGRWRQVGRVQQVGGAEPPARIELLWFDDYVSSNGYRFVYHRNRGGLDQVLATMLPRGKQERIKRRITAAIERYGDELSAAFLPLIEQTVRESLPVIEQEIQASTQRHRAELDRLGARWREELLAERLVPLARREILPIVRRHGEPVAEEIGKELWNRASLWRFGWRAVYDRTPLPERNLVQEEWDRFVEREAIPVFESRTDDIVLAVQRVLSDVAANAAVRSELADVIDQAAADPEARALLNQILRESLVESPRLQAVWRDIWQSDQAQQALKLAGDRLEPVVRGIGDDLFGTRDGGIDPDFARVLRNQILAKDRRWLIATRQTSSSGEEDAAVIMIADTFMPFPVVHLAGESAPEDSEGRSDRD